MNAATQLKALTNREAVLSLPARRASLTLRRIGQGLAILALATASYFFVSRFVVQSVTVSGSSMSPALSNGDHYLLNRWIFHVRAPHRSEIVVLRDPLDQGYSVKRIIAVAGDLVSVKQGRVYINGREYQESYLTPGTVTLANWPATEQAFTCGQGQYFLLGDNRNNSIDSRTYGVVPRGNILGLVVR